MASKITTTIEMPNSRITLFYTKLSKKNIFILEKHGVQRNRPLAAVAKTMPQTKVTVMGNIHEKLF